MAFVKKRKLVNDDHWPFFDNVGPDWKFLLESGKICQEVHKIPFLFSIKKIKHNTVMMMIKKRSTFIKFFS